MTKSADARASMRFSTEDLPEKDRVAAFQDIYARSIIKHDIEPLPDSPLLFSAEFLALPGVTVASGICSALHATRTPQHIDSDDVVLNISLTGGRVLRQRKREALIRPGEAVLAASAEVGVATVLELSQFISLRFPLRNVTPLLNDPDDAFVRAVPRDLSSLQMLVGYVRLLEKDFASATPELRALTASHLHDLVAMVLGATRDAKEIARGRGVRAARLLSIKRDIAQNIGRRDLSAETVAARHGISASYVRKLLEAEGTSFTDFVLGQRVATAYRMLTSPRFAGRAISTIAFDAGFSDLSYFNRVFRRHYGSVPSEVRSQNRTLVVRGELKKRPVLSSWSSVLDYCRTAQAFAEKEQFRVLFLDKRNQLIADELQQTGTVDHTPVYPREVVKRALELSATALILVHNHPSGDPTPSRADIQMTQSIVEIAKPLGIDVHDHIIVGKEGHASLKGLRLI